MNKYSKGYLGEFIAIIILMIKGYRFLYSRYKTSCGEIDIIAKKHNTLVFVEVKTRHCLEQCYDAIRKRQLKRIENASLIFISKNNRYIAFDIRYDAFLVSSTSFPKHVKNINMCDF